MGRYLVGRLVSAVLALLAVTVFVLVAFDVLPNGQQRPGLTTTYRIHGSLPQQYGEFLWNLIRHADLGRSYQDRELVTTQIGAAAPVTLSLVVGGVLVWLVVAIPLGLLAALRPRSALDVAVMGFVLIGVSVHPLWLGLVLGFVFGSHWHVLPAAGYCDLFSPSTACGGPAQWFGHLLLPWLTFGLLNAALYTLMIRALVREELDKDYVLAARARGAGTARVLRSHVTANLLPPFVTMIGMNIGIALAGVVFVESAFGLPGLGGILRQAIFRKDLPLTAGIVLCLTMTIVLLNLIVDLTYPLLDPRVRRPAPARA